MLLIDKSKLIKFKKFFNKNFFKIFKIKIDKSKSPTEVWIVVPSTPVGHRVNPWSGCHGSRASSSPSDKPRGRLPYFADRTGHAPQWTCPTSSLVPKPLCWTLFAHPIPDLPKTVELACIAQHFLSHNWHQVLTEEEGRCCELLSSCQPGYHKAYLLNTHYQSTKKNMRK